MSVCLSAKKGNERFSKPLIKMFRRSTRFLSSRGNYSMNMLSGSLSAMLLQSYTFHTFIKGPDFTPQLLSCSCYAEVSLLMHPDHTRTHTFSMWQLNFCMESNLSWQKNKPTRHRCSYLRSREEDEVASIFVFSHIWMVGYFRLGWERVRVPHWVRVPRMS